ncbi:hypothetical protein RI065_04325 [Mycoplasmatota bacterium zrk1]
MFIFRFRYRYKFYVVLSLVMIGVLISILLSYLNYDLYANIILALFIFIASILYVLLNDSEKERYGEYKESIEYLTTLSKNMRTQFELNELLDLENTISQYLEIDIVKRQVIDSKRSTKILKKLLLEVRHFANKMNHAKNLLNLNGEDYQAFVGASVLKKNQYKELTKEFIHKDLNDVTLDVLELNKLGNRYSRSVRKFLTKIDKDTRYFDKQFRNEQYKDLVLDKQIVAITVQVTERIKKVEQNVYDGMDSLNDRLENEIKNSLQRVLEIIDRIIDERIEDIEFDTTIVEENENKLDIVINNLEAQDRDLVYISNQVHSVSQKLNQIEYESGEIDQNIVAELDELIQSYLGEAVDSIEEKIDNKLINLDL